MKIVRLLCGLHLTLLIVFSLAARADEGDPSSNHNRVDSLSCDHTLDEWQTLINSWAGAPEKVNISSLQICSQTMPPSVQACTSNLLKYVIEKKKIALNLNPIEKPNAELVRFSAAHPEVLNLPDAIYDQGDLRTNWESIYKSCQDSNFVSQTCAPLKDWTMLQFRSQISGPGDGLSRVISFVPGKEYDRYYQNFRSTGVSVTDLIVIEKIRDGKTLASPVPHFLASVDFNSRISNTMAEQSFAQCYTCHANAVREIEPSPGSIKNFADDAKLLKINTNIQSHGRIDLSDYVNVHNLGPGMGQSMGCTGCHNSDEISQRSRNILTDHQNRSLLQGKMDLHEFAMPQAIGGIMLPNYSKAMAQIKLLDEKDRAEIDGFFDGGAHSPGSYRAHADELVAKQKLLLFIKNKKIDGQNLISENEYQKAASELTQVDQIMTKKSDEMIAEYKQDLKSWLSGGSISCVKDHASKIEAQKPPAPGEN